MEPIRQKACLNPLCSDVGKLNAGNIILHASFDPKSGTRQRCLCKTCGRTFSANTGTAYVGLRCSHDEFDQVATMRVEGNSISAIDRMTGRSRSTIDRWLKRAAVSAKRFNNEHLRDFEITQLQADSCAPLSAAPRNRREKPVDRTALVQEVPQVGLLYRIVRPEQPASKAPATARHLLVAHRIGRIGHGQIELVAGPELAHQHWHPGIEGRPLARREVIIESVARSLGVDVHVEKRQVGPVQ